MVNDSVEIAEDAADDERDRVRIRYYSVTHSREETITSCEGDLIVICNVLADYADMLDEFLQTDRERLGFCGALQYERMRDRCRKITADLQEKTGYDRAAAIEKCRKRAGRKPKADAGIGEDALVLSARRRAGAQQPAAENRITIRTGREGIRPSLFLSAVSSRSRRQKVRKNMGLDMDYKAEVFVDTENLSREDWLSFRRKGIGGSDAAAIMGMSPFSTKRDLYYDKLGIQAVMDEEEDNWVAKEVGHRLEDLVAEIFSRKTGLKVYPVRKMFRHPFYPFMLADVDFFIDFPDGSKGILECKTTNYNCQGKWANDSTPVNYEYQGRHYMAVMNIDRMYFACLYGNNENEFFIRYMERDLDIEEDLIAEEEFFWKENVEKGVEPPYTEKPDLVLESIRKHCGPADKDAEQVKLGRKHLGSIRKYMELKEQKAQHDSEAKKLEEKMKEAYAEIVEEMGVSCTGVIKDGGTEYVVSYNPAYRTGIDKKGLERLKAQHPDVYDDYVNTTESRRFSVKTKGAA